MTDEIRWPDPIIRKYPKINSTHKRGERGVLLDGWATPELELLAVIPWEWTEKVDGTNIRLGWDRMLREVIPAGGAVNYIRGRGDDAQIPPKLLAVLSELLVARIDLLGSTFAEAHRATLYGEGYGAGVQKGGTYRPDPGFVLFDVTVDVYDPESGETVTWWMTRDAVADIAEKLDLDVVQTVAICTVPEAIDLVRNDKLTSAWPTRERPEGVVGRPVTMLRDRRGDLITTKIKWKDYARG